MLTVKDFHLKETDTKGEYWGNEKSGKVVIFSHGFGVKRDARGMFKELGALLKDDYLVVLFDYTDIDSQGNANAYPFSRQADKLCEVIQFVRSNFTPKEINLIAHSQGCIIVGLVSPSDIKKIILVAGPIASPSERIKEYFSQREGTQINEEGISIIKRSDGTITYIPTKYWQEGDRVDPANLYLSLAEKSKVNFVRAKQDQIVVGEDYSKITGSGKIEYIELEGKHDFENEARNPWLAKMVQILKQ